MNNWKKLLGIGVAVGLLLVLFQYVFRFDTKIFQAAILLLGLIALVATSVYKTASTSKFRKRVQSQLALIEAGKAGEALTDMEDMVQELDSRKMQHQAALCRLNRTAAHRELGQYEQSLEILQGLSGETFEGLENVVYRLNLCTEYFHVGQNDRGVEFYLENEKLFDEYDHHKRYGGNINQLAIYAYIAQGRLEESERMLEKAKEAYTDRRFQADFRILEDRLAQAKAAPQPALEEKTGE